MAKSLVSVIIPCYNAERYIGSALQSVVDQTYPWWEAIVINDGSTDRSEDHINKFLGDKRFRYDHQENKGVSSARNRGITLSKGNCIAFLDADDLYQPENLKLKMDFLDQNTEIDLVHSSEEVFNSETGQVIEIAKGQGGSTLHQLLELSTKVVHSPSSVVVRRELLEKTGFFDEKLSTSADWELWVRLARHTDFGFIPVPLVRYQLHQNQMHLNVSKMESDMLYAFHKVNRSGAFISKLHYQRCMAKLRLILAASFIGHERRLDKFIINIVFAFLSSPLIFWREIRSKIFQYE